MAWAGFEGLTFCCFATGHSGGLLFSHRRPPAWRGMPAVSFFAIPAVCCCRQFHNMLLLFLTILTSPGRVTNVPSKGWARQGQTGDLEVGRRPSLGSIQTEPFSQAGWRVWADSLCGPAEHLCCEHVCRSSFSFTKQYLSNFPPTQGLYMCASILQVARSCQHKTCISFSLMFSRHFMVAATLLSYPLFLSLM